MAGECTYIHIEGMFCRVHTPLPRPGEVCQVAAVQGEVESLQTRIDKALRILDAAASYEPDLGRHLMLTQVREVLAGGREAVEVGDRGELDVE